MLKRKETKASLIGLMMFSLFGCTKQELIHVPVGCLGLPTVNVKFTQEEADAIPDSAVDKIVLMRETYKARINAQCEINYKHDELYESK